jgi:hypothetical protein
MPRGTALNTDNAAISSTYCSPRPLPQLIAHHGHFLNLLAINYLNRKRNRNRNRNRDRNGVEPPGPINIAGVHLFSASLHPPLLRSSLAFTTFDTPHCLTTTHPSARVPYHVVSH